jgi:hypothetical protein
LYESERRKSQLGADEEEEEDFHHAKAQLKSLTKNLVSAIAIYRILQHRILAVSNFYRAKENTRTAKVNIRIYRNAACWLILIESERTRLHHSLVYHQKLQASLKNKKAP